MAKKVRTKEEIKKARRKRWLIVLVAVIVVIGGLHIADRLCCRSLIKYIETFDPVDYAGTSRSLPVYDEAAGHYSFSSEDGLKIMMLTDIHLGGGRWTRTTDKKAVYEIITMLQNEKPDLVVLCGDNVFACPGPIYNGGGNLDNKLVSKVILEIFEHEGVYFTTVFGNHDTEVFDLCGRQKLADLYESDKYAYCLFKQEYTDADAKIPSVTNQIITVKNADREMNKLLLLIDTNAYVDKSIKAVLDWNYDVIHQDQVDWAKDEIGRLSQMAGYPGRTCLDTVTFMHIPVGEFQQAYLDLEGNGFKETEDAIYLSGVWDEKIDDTLGIRIWYGGCSTYRDAPEEADSFFETLGPEGTGALEAIFCGHDHTNNVAVLYKGVTLAYGMSMDNTAYDDIAQSGRQRGCTIINIDSDGSMSWEYKNAYLDCGVDPDKFMHVYTDHYYYDGQAPAN